VHPSQQFWSDGSLSFGGWISIGKGFEEGRGGRGAAGQSQDVQGTWLEIVPKRRSQVACGFSLEVLVTIGTPSIVPLPLFHCALLKAGNEARPWR
jgi:hypothetical protein